jgi:ankyrin repeat protein
MFKEENQLSLTSIPTDITHNYMQELDCQSKVAFALTCSKFYTHYTNNKVVLLGNLKPMDYIRDTIHCARKKKTNTLNFLIAHEGARNKEIRKAIKDQFEESITDLFEQEYGVDYKFNIKWAMKNNPLIMFVACYHGYDLNAKDNFGHTILHRAVDMQKLEKIKTILALDLFYLIEMLKITTVIQRYI